MWACRGNIIKTPTQKQIWRSMEGSFSTTKTAGCMWMRVNKMKKIDTITSEERAFFFPDFEKNSNLKMVANRMNLPQRPNERCRTQ